MKFETEWNIGERVHIDGDTSVTAVICGFVIEHASHNAKCEWWKDGKIEDRPIEIFRLSKAEKKS